MGILSSIFGGSGKKAAQAAMQASQTAAQGQQQGVDYLMEREALPREISERALTGLDEFYQVPPQSQEELIQEATQSPLYKAIMGTRAGGEEAILRNLSATGGLRSGNANEAMYDYNVQLENKALLDSFDEQKAERQMQLSGLAGLAGLPSYAPQIAQGMGDIGMTEGMGITAAQQAREQAKQNRFGNILAIGKLGLQGAMAFSDIRLKKNITYKGMKDGWPWYEWEWIPEAEDKLGLSGKAQGVLAHHVYERQPDAVGEAMGFLTVDYDKLEAA